MASSLVKKNTDPTGIEGSIGQGTGVEELGHPFQISALKPGWILHLLARIEKLFPKFVRQRIGFLSSFKNRILISTLILLVGVVFVIGVTLQIAIFPKLRGDSTVIFNLKVLHFLASIVVIFIGWCFIEFISKRIALPLRQLTETADQISREAGGGISNGTLNGIHHAETRALELTDAAVEGDEIVQLTSSFNRMLAHLKASEARLRESEEKYRFLFDSGPSPIFVMDADDLRILDVNARAEEEYQHTRQDFLNMSFADLGLDRDREATRNRLKHVFATEITFLPVLQHRRRDGSPFMVNFQASLSRYRNRPAIIAAVWDVTERLERQAKLIQAGKMATLGEMATGIAHELNQPLNIVRLGCDYLSKKTKSGQSVSAEDLNQVLEELAYSVQRASRIINHLRQFGRRADDIMFPIDINGPIVNVFTLVGTQLKSRGIRWTLSLDVNLPKIMGDDNRLEQVFINLILNARDAILSKTSDPTAEGEAGDKVITIKSFSETDRVLVTVSDTGPGIPESIRPKVFEPFFTTKKTGEGTGLGLSISYGIVKEHKGTIEIDPTATEGTTFRLSFPALKNGDQ
ncbi:MAG: PAS domain S-box protein [Desulfomonile tiedjei]|nr:PAS domain S-box protein [Desulfomonile tiedjei]